MGDGWEHRITCREVDIERDLAPPICLDGEHACPLEDVGGIHQHHRMLKALEQAEDPEDQEFAQWAVAQFKDDCFSARHVSAALLTWWRDVVIKE